MRNIIRCTGIAAIMTGLFLCAQPGYGKTSQSSPSNFDLPEMCTQANHLSKNKAWYWCVGEVNGVVQGFHVGALYVYGLYMRALPEQKLITPPPLFCPPERKNSRQDAALIVTKYLKHHPELAHNSNMQVEPDAELIIKALSVAWPCKQ